MEFIIKKINKNKVFLIILNMLLFAIIYSFFNDSDWKGLNPVKEVVKDEIIREKAEADLDKDTLNYNKGLNTGLEGMSNIYMSNNKNNNIEISNVKKEVEEDLKSSKHELTFFEYIFNRLYFSVVTGCLLGYGDIYPETLRLKGFVALQALTTLIIIVL